MTTFEDVHTLLPRLLHDIAGVPMDLIRPDATFRDDLQVDSLSMAEIMVATEDSLGIVIPDDEADKLTSIDDVVGYVARVRA